MNVQQLGETLHLIAPYIADLLGGPTLVELPRRPNLQPISSYLLGGGVHVSETSILGYAVGHDDRVVSVQFNRLGLPYSDLEVSLLNHLFKSVTTLARSLDDAKRGTHQRTAIFLSAFDIAISRFLRQDRRRFANIQNIIQVAKELTVQRYEGEPCTSGFLYVNQPRKGYLDRLNAAGYRLTTLAPGIVVAPRFFGSPLAYRYVDGVRAVYLTQIWRLCVGILQLDPTVPLTDEDVTNHTPFRSALMPTQPQSFCVFANRNSEVDVMFGKGDLLRWRGGQWRLLELTRLRSLFSEYLVDQSTAAVLAEVVVSVSTSRHGALILLRLHDTEPMATLRHIDESPIGRAVRRRLIGLRAIDAHQNGVLVPAFTSDGLTIIDRDGAVVDSGVLVNISGIGSLGGGGRTAAAESASHYGLAIKISQDGPIELWREGRIILRQG